MDAAQAELIKRAIPDVMALLKAQMRTTAPRRSRGRSWIRRW